MRTSVWVLAVVALAITTACSTPKGEEFTTSDAATIRQKNQEFVEAFNGKQVPKILSLYADNSVFMPPNMPTIRGRGALEGYYSDQFRQGAGNLKLEVGEVSGHGPLAYQTGVYELDYRRRLAPRPGQVPVRAAQHERDMAAAVHDVEQRPARRGRAGEDRTEERQSPDATFTTRNGRRTTPTIRPSTLMTARATYAPAGSRAMGIAAEAARQ